jgi:hypothetical protein
MPYAIYIRGWGWIGAGDSEDEAASDVQSKIVEMMTDRTEIYECTSDAVCAINEHGIYAKLRLNESGIVCASSEEGE